LLTPYTVILMTIRIQVIENTPPASAELGVAHCPAVFAPFGLGPDRHQDDEIWSGDLENFIIGDTHPFPDFDFDGGWTRAQKLSGAFQTNLDRSGPRMSDRNNQTLGENKMTKSKNLCVFVVMLCTVLGTGMAAAQKTNTADGESALLVGHICDGHSGDFETDILDNAVPPNSTTVIQHGRWCVVNLAGGQNQDHIFPFSAPPAVAGLYDDPNDPECCGPPVQFCILGARDVSGYLGNNFGLLYVEVIGTSRTGHPRLGRLTANAPCITLPRKSVMYMQIPATTNTQPVAIFGFWQS
jgi:hypothetical protein